MSFASKTVSEFSEWLRCNNFSKQVIQTLEGTCIIIMLSVLTIVDSKQRSARAGCVVVGRITKWCKWMRYL